MKIVYMGTPDFAVPALEALIEAGHEITAVVTQPDRPKGRGKEMAFSPVKECALKHGLQIFQPEKIKEESAVNTLKSFEADIYVVAAFGQILSQEILDIPRFGCINIHASILPKYRGAAPIQFAILEGDEETGVTIQQMNAGMDTGDIIAIKTIPITETDTAGSMFDKLMMLGAELVTETLPRIEKGEITPVPQDESKATKCGKIHKEMGHINWNASASSISNLVRAMNPWPSSFTRINGKMLKIWTVKAIPERANNVPGTVYSVDKDSFCVNTGDGILEISEVQLEGKKRMDVKSFLLGYDIEKGMTLG